MKNTGLYDKLNSMNDKEYIENFLLFNISQVLSGIKPASTISFMKSKDNIYDKWLKYGADFINSIGLKFIELREKVNLLVLLIYNEEILSESIFGKEQKKFLLGIGYEDEEDVNKYINKLKERYELYHCPHELGLFLGIPIKDVKDFMNCTSKKCLLCGYWKVYNDSSAARLIFNKYDEIKVHTLKGILKGYNSQSLALSIKNFFCTP
ncbi:MAG: DUF3793 family protein [Clostridium sp.]|uniref:DUF3793 family protein n=1 Tax=Clostridium sp. DSM 8431 TaxID=1761781 RepID=UPI0008DF3BDD|nr:DUF3793 family protein [Clostridium sp. DSM 8431]MCR4945224.1 DUF3793 family protein [Clostridium sp.]SFU76943.1 Protein of unknown function [Clostridium sp. DSM 8431]